MSKAIYDELTDGKNISELTGEQMANKFKEMLIFYAETPLFWLHALDKRKTEHTQLRVSDIELSIKGLEEMKDLLDEYKAFLLDFKAALEKGEEKDE